MPRAFDSDEVAHGDQAAGEYMLRFTENVDCPACGAVSEGVFHDDSDSVEDIDTAPVGEHTCPACGHHWASELTGWTFFSEAG